MNFALILFVLLVITGVAWIADKILFRPRRVRAADKALAAFERTNAGRVPDAAMSEKRLDIRASADKQPLWLEYTAGLFPVILVVFMLRSFVAEPFKIPSGSMIPTLLVGDLILVNKFTYGIRLPVIHTKVLTLGAPKRGDVMVFRYPKDPTMDYIKRVVGLPGDRISFENNRLKLNNEPVPITDAGEFYDSERLAYYHQYSEKLGEINHKILTDLEKTSFISPMEPFPFQDRCKYGQAGVICVVPPGHYFVMGDNRDNSLDSRFWGFVPEQNIVGKAFFVWMNLSSPSRIGGFK
jgi:signal peptidase I